MKQLNPEAVRHRILSRLGLDSGRYALESEEAIASALRRTARFLCPCVEGTLVRSVVKPLRGLVTDLQATKEKVAETLEAMVAYGDLLEFEELETDQAKGGKRLFAARLAFVSRKNGSQFVVGITEGNINVFPGEFERRIEHIGYTRRLNPINDEDLGKRLRDCGLHQIKSKAWLKAPEIKDPADLKSKYDSLLRKAGRSGSVPGLRLLDPTTSVRYYRSRWVEPRKHTGHFVARREQAYGAPLWSYVHVIQGEPQALIDLPERKHRWRACDEAWHLQMAIDKTRGNPQLFDIRTGPDESRVMAFFSPVPMWAQRRWDFIGQRIPNERCLFAYQIPNNELCEELDFIRQCLWLEQINEGE